MILSELLVIAVTLPLYLLIAHFTEGRPAVLVGITVGVILVLWLRMYD